jgi:hypothetical protein
MSGSKAEIQEGFYNPYVIFGCDPEIFFKTDEKIIGSEKVLSKNGLEQLSTVVKDGIQAELHPQANTCRQVLADNIRRCFVDLVNGLEGNVNIDFSPLVKIEQEEMDSLTEDSKKFGCNPSCNAKNKQAEVVVKDASKYLFRSAGGHVHVGVNPSEITRVHEDIDNVAKVMDYIVGNTCVLLDRHEGNVERRKNYGRAGEYRLKEYGLEYRTPSNFWLRHYVVYSFVFGLVRYAYNVWEQDKFQEFFHRVDYSDIEKAINENDFDLAKANFDKIKDLFPKNNYVVGQNGYDSLDGDNFYPIPITQKNLPKFEEFVKVGIDKIFDPKSTLDNWINLNAHVGWEKFIENFNQK